MEELGKEIAKARKAQGLSLRDVAAKVGLSYESVSNAERGVAKLKTATRIAQVLGISKSAAFRAATTDLKKLMRAG